MQLFGEENVIGDVLHDLAHQRESALHARRRLDVDDAGLARRHWQLKYRQYTLHVGRRPVT